MESANAEAGSTPSQGWHLVRIAVAGLLLTASALKCWQLATEPTIGTSLLDSRWLLMATVEFELFFGLWLLANILPKATWAAALGCFGLFTVISLYKAISGYATCGCFGRIVVNPWLTTTIDLAVVFSLLYWRPKGPESLFGSFRQLPMRVVGVLAIWLAAGVPAAYAMGSYSSTTLSENGNIIGNEDIVVLEPGKWAGKRFPLLAYIDIGDKLKEGEWLVVLYHHDCPKCLEEIPKYEEQARKWADEPMAPHLALIEMPPFGTQSVLSVSPDAPCSIGRLSEEKKWFVETPAVVSLRSALVIPWTEKQYISHAETASLR